MRMLMLVVFLSAACQDRDRSPTSDDRITVRKSVEPDHEFESMRHAYQAQARARLARLNERIDELGKQASVDLHAKRDQLAARIEQLDQQGEADWDQFRRDLSAAFDDVEHDLIH